MSRVTKRSPTDSPINAERGEFTLSLDGQIFGLRPSYEAMEAIEAETGKGLIALARAALGGEMGLHDLSIVVCECVRAWGRQTGSTNAAGANPSNIGRLVMSSEGGMAGAMSVIGAMLSVAVTGGITPEGEVKAATETIRKTDSAPAAA